MRKSKLKSVGLYSMLLVAAIAIVFPFFWIISLSIRPESEIYTIPLKVISPQFTLVNFVKTITYPDLLLSRWYANSAIVSILGVFGVLFLASLAAYAFAKLCFPGRDILFIMILGSLMIPPESTLVVRYIITKWLGWFNTYQSLIVPLLPSAFAVFLLRQFFLSLPVELEDAAKIDGCSRLGVYMYIILPLSKPVMAALGIFTFMFYWNDFTWPLVAITDIKMRTLTIGLAVLQGQYGGQEGVIMAATVLATFPVVMVYMIFQKNIIRGIALTGIKM